MSWYVQNLKIKELDKDKAGHHHHHCIPCPFLRLSDLTLSLVVGREQLGFRMTGTFRGI